jgi:hypothetical protein
MHPSETRHMSMSFYRRALLAPYAFVAVAGILVALSHLTDNLSASFDFVVQLSALVVSGSVVVLPVYTVLAFYLWRRSHRSDFTVAKAHEWLTTAPAVLAVSLMAAFGLRGLVSGKPLEGFMVGLVIGAFAIPFGYLLVFLLLAGARVFRARRT